MNHKTYILKRIPETSQTSTGSRRRPDFPTEPQYGNHTTNQGNPRLSPRTLHFLPSESWQYYWTVTRGMSPICRLTVSLRFICQPNGHYHCQAMLSNSSCVIQVTKLIGLPIFEIIASVMLDSQFSSILNLFRLIWDTTGNQKLYSRPSTSIL